MNDDDDVCRGGKSIQKGILYWSKGTDTCINTTLVKVKVPIQYLDSSKSIKAQVLKCTYVINLCHLFFHVSFFTGEAYMANYINKYTTSGFSLLSSLSERRERNTIVTAGKSDSRKLMTFCPQWATVVNPGASRSSECLSSVASNKVAWNRNPGVVHLHDD